MMSTGLVLVGKTSGALVIVLVIPPSNDAVVGEVLPCHSGMTASAPHAEAVEEVAARQGILGGEERGEFPIAGNAQSIIEGLFI